jgi:DNA primase
MNFDIIQILDGILGLSKTFAKGEHYYHCPFCHHYNPKLAVNIVKGKWQCWKCGARGGTLLSLLRKLDVPRDQYQKLARILKDEIPRIETDEVVTALTLPKEYLPLWEVSNTIAYKLSLEYVQKRGFTMCDIIKHQVGYCPSGIYKDRVIVPSFDDSGSLNYFVGRRIYSNGLNYLTPPISKNIIGFEYQLNWNYPIVLVEGAFDAMATKRNACPLMGKHVSKKLQQKIIEQGVPEIYLALDADALKDTIKIAERFMRENIKVYVVELHGKDPASIGQGEMARLIKSAKPLNFSELMNLKLKLC